MLYPNNTPREASLPVSVKIGILKYTTYIFFSPKEYNCHLLDGYLRDDIQYPRHVTFGVQPQGRLTSPAALSSRVPSPSLPGPPTGHCCVPPHPSPAPSQYILACLPSRATSFDISAFPLLGSRLWMAFPLVTDFLPVPKTLGSGHLWGLVRGESSSSRVNECPSIHHQLPETEHSRVPSLIMAQSKDAVTESKYPGVTTPHLLTSLVLAPGFIISVRLLIQRFFKP